MIRACDDCGNVFAPTYPDQWECDECDDRRTLECFRRLEEIEHGRALLEAAPLYDAETEEEEARIAKGGAQ